MLRNCAALLRPLTSPTRQGRHTGKGRLRKRRLPLRGSTTGAVRLLVVPSPSSCDLLGIFIGKIKTLTVGRVRPPVAARPLHKAIHEFRG